MISIRLSLDFNFHADGFQEPFCLLGLFLWAHVAFQCNGIIKSKNSDSEEIAHTVRLGRNCLVNRGKRQRTRRLTHQELRVLRTQFISFVAIKNDILFLWSFAAASTDKPIRFEQWFYNVALLQACDCTRADFTKNVFVSCSTLQEQCIKWVMSSMCQLSREFAEL